MRCKIQEVAFGLMFPKNNHPFSEARVVRLFSPARPARLSLHTGSLPTKKWRGEFYFSF